MSTLPRSSIFAIIYSVVLIAISGCDTPTNREKFESYLRQPIGKSEYSNYNDFRTYVMRRDMLISTEVLPNGNEERRYKFFKACVVVVEIETGSRIIVATRSEGVQEDCRMPF